MTIQWAETGTEVAVGALSGYLTSMREKSGAAPLWDMNKNDPNSFKLYADTAEELAAALGGAALQYFSPRTMPNVADGLADAGFTLLARRVAHHFGATGGLLGGGTGTTTANPQAIQQAMAAYAMQGAGWGVPSASPQLGSVSGVRRNQSW